MINVYKSIITYDGGDDFFDEYLKEVYIYDIFKDLYNDFKDPVILKGVVLFIVMSYSIDSDMIHTTGKTWGELASKIFTKTGLPEKYYDEVAGLENENVRSTIDKWLQHQNNEHWTQYILYRDLRRQFLSAALFHLPKKEKKVLDDGTVVLEDADFSKMKSLVEAKQLCATNSNELLKMMNEAKDRFIQTQPKLRTSVSELNKVTHQKATKSTEEIFTNG